MKELVRGKGITGNAVEFLVTLGINEADSKKKIDAFLLKTIKEKKVTIGVNIQQSNANINNFLNKIQSRVIKTTIDVNKEASRSNINKFLNEMRNAKGSINFSADTSQKKMKEITSSLPVVAGKIVGELDVAATKKRIKEQIPKIKLPKMQIDVVANVSPNVKNALKNTTTTTQAAPKQATETKTYEGTKAQAVKKLKEEYAALGQQVSIFNGSVAKGEASFVAALKAQGHQVKITRDAQTKEISQIAATYRNSANEIQTTYFKPLVAQYQNLSSKANAGVREMRGFAAVTQQINNTERFDLGKGVEQLTTRLKNAKHQAQITTAEYNKLMQATQATTSKNDVDKISNSLKEQIRLTREQVQLINAREKAMAKISAMESGLLRIQRQYPTYYKENNAQFAALQSKMNDLKSNSALTAANLSNLTMGNFRALSPAISEANSQLRLLDANATYASRAAMGLAEQLKVAFTRFPIWMLASTAFYGVIGTFRDFGSVIVDVDTKMTNLKKVMDESTDFDKVFVQATESATLFGQTLTDVLESYGEFARQGFKGDELQELSNTALITSNVAELGAGESAQFITSALIQWKKEAQDSMS